MSPDAQKLASGTATPMPDTLPFADAVRLRRAARGFLPTPVDRKTIDRVLEDAQYTPSNCNTQPWDVHVVSDATRDRLSEALVADFLAQRYSLDFSFDQSAYTVARSGRWISDQAKAFFDAMGVAREDTQGRADVVAHNLRFFGAPHVALLFMPAVGDNVRVAADMGMYAQTFLLSLAARGLFGLPQTLLGMFADRTRKVLGVPDELKLLFGISFGHLDASAPGNSYRIGRDPISETVTFHD